MTLDKLINKRLIQQFLEKLRSFLLVDDYFKNHTNQFFFGIHGQDEGKMKNVGVNVKIKIFFFSEGIK